MNRPPRRELGYYALSLLRLRPAYPRPDLVLHVSHPGHAARGAARTICLARGVSPARERHHRVVGLDADLSGDVRHGRDPVHHHGLDALVLGEAALLHCDGRRYSALPYGDRARIALRQLLA